MNKIYLITANDSLEAYLIEAILNKNDIKCEIEVLKSLKKKKYRDLPDKANVFVDKEKYDEALTCIEVISDERKMKEEHEEENRLFSRKQLFFAITISIVFLLIVIWAVLYSLK